MTPIDDFRELRGVQTPTFQSIPEGRTGSSGAAAIKLADMAGLRLDPWQAWSVDHMLAERADTYYNLCLRKYVHRSLARDICLVVARQNGKGAILEAVELAWLFLLGAGDVIHSAHEYKTATMHFERVESLISQTPELKAKLGRGGIKWGNSDRSITLNCGCRVMFSARTKGAVRGLSPGKIVMDEAMYLKPEHVKAMVPAASAQPDPQIVLTGSVGNSESAHFGKAREHGVKGTNRRQFFAEWSAELCTPFCPRGPSGQRLCTVHDDPGHPLTWAKANPGMWHRLDIETIESEYLSGLPGDAFTEERLSVGDWPTDAQAWAVISQAGWTALEEPSSRVKPPMTFGIETSPDLRWSAIVAAGANQDGNIHVEVTGSGDRADFQAGPNWVVQRAVEINAKQRNAQWVVHKSGQAGMHWDALEKAGLKLIAPTTADYAQSCGDFFSSVMRIGDSRPDVRHTGQPELAAAVSNAEMRTVGDSWAWDKRTDNGDVSCLVAATLAVWGHRKRLNKPPPKPGFMWM